MHYIYKLVFKETDMFYIGQTSNLDTRFDRHWTSLQKGTHHNLHMQRWCNKHLPKFMGMVVLDRIEDQGDCDLREIEMINETYHENFNISKKAQGGDLVSYHPNRDAIANKHSQNWLNQISSGKRPPNEPKYGKENPNYRHGKSSTEVLEKATCPDCNTPIETKVLGTRCKPCNSTYISSLYEGEGNPFFGKHHSEKTCEILRQKGKERYQNGFRPKNSRAVVAEGVYYESISACSRSYGCHSSLVTYRLKSSKWDFEYYDPDKHSKLK